MLDLDGAAAGEALLVLPERAGGVDRPGVDADVALDDDLGGGLLAGGHEGDGRGGEESESELGHFRLFVCEGARVRRGGGRRLAGFATWRVPEPLDPVLGELQRSPAARRICAGQAAQPRV